jgi:predicted DNA-binding mobile mystery protein A
MLNYSLLSQSMYSTMKPEFRQLRLSQLDRGLAQMQSIPSRPAVGWLASVREALGLTLGQIGQRVRASRQAVQQFEKAEANDRITLAALRRVAEAMGCELVYALVPRTGSFAELAERPTRDRAKRDVESVMHTMMLEGQKPENAKQMLEDEAQRRLNRGKPP